MESQTLWDQIDALAKRLRDDAMIELTIEELLKNLGRAESAEAVEDVLYDLEGRSAGERVDAIERGASDPRRYAPQAANRFVSNMTELAHDVLTETDLDAEVVARLTRALVSLVVRWAADPEHDPDVVYMFWDRLLFSTWRDGSVLRDHGPLIANALDELMHESNPACVRSAIHGLNHMPPELRTGPLERFVERSQDVGLRDFALRALSGRLQ